MKKQDNNMPADKYKTGFTLVETIAASTILCMAVLALGAISTRSLGSMRLNRQYEEAASLADKQLAFIDFIGIESFIEAGQMQGESKGLRQTYYWKAETAYEGTDNLYEVAVTVSWLDRRQVCSISVNTMLNGTGQLLVTTPAE